MIKEARDGGSITPALMEYLLTQTTTVGPKRLEMLCKTTVAGCSWQGTHWKVQLFSSTDAELEFDCIVLATGRYSARILLIEYLCSNIRSNCINCVWN